MIANPPVKQQILFVSTALPFEVGQFALKIIARSENRQGGRRIDELQEMLVRHFLQVKIEALPGVEIHRADDADRNRVGVDIHCEVFLGDDAAQGLFQVLLLTQRALAGYNFQEGVRFLDATVRLHRGLVEKLLLPQVQHEFLDPFAEGSVVQGHSQGHRQEGPC